MLTDAIASAFTEVDKVKADLDLATAVDDLVATKVIVQDDFIDVIASMANGSVSPEDAQVLLNQTILLPNTLNRFQNSDTPGSYMYAGEEESVNIRANFPQFVEEGEAFEVSLQAKDDDDLIAFNRFQNSDVPGSYIYAGEEESVNIRANFPQFVEEGIAFYTFGADADRGADIYRFQNSNQPGTFIFVGEEEAVNIRANFPQFVEEGIAFEVAL